MLTYSWNKSVCLGAILFVALLDAGCASAARRGKAPPAAVAGQHGNQTQPTGVQPGSGSEKSSGLWSDDGKYAETPAEAQSIRAQAHYGTGVFYDLQGQSDLASEHFRKAALDDPGNETLVLEVSQRFLVAKQPDKALEVLTKSIALPTASANLYAALGVAYAELGKNDLAISADRTALKKRPQLLQAYQNLFQLYLQHGQTKEAIGLFEEALRQSSPTVAFRIDLADLFVNFRALLGRSAENLRPRILAELNAAALAKPANLFLLQKLGDAYQKLGELSKAAEIYEQLLARYPNLPLLREKLTDIYWHSGDTRRASEQLEAMIRDNPSNGRAYYLLGALAAEVNEFQKAVDYFEKALLFGDAFDQVYFDLARAQLALNQPEKALTALAKARAKTPRNFLLEFFTALAYGELKNYPEAIKHLTEAEVIAAISETNRLTHEFYFQLGAAYERTKDYQQAEKNFQKCLALAPDDAEALNYLGYMWAERGVNLEQAKVLIEKAVKLAPNNAAYIDSLGWVLFKLDQAKDALPKILKAIELSPKPDPTLLDHLGDIYAALREPDKAREAWRKSLQIEANDVIKRKLETASAQSGAKP